MESRERSREVQRREPEVATPEPVSRNVTDMRQAGSELLDAADDAINRALSGDSEAFLSANRQESGQ